MFSAFIGCARLVFSWGTNRRSVTLISDNSHPCIAEVKNGEAVPSLPYVFTAEV
jgi:hypothetical protein